MAYNSTHTGAEIDAAVDLVNSQKQDIASLQDQLDSLGEISTVHGSITFPGADPKGTLGDDYTGLTPAQLMTKYPFNRLHTQSFVGYDSSHAALAGEDRFLVMPNFYKKVTTGSDGSLKIDISNVQIDSGYARCYDVTGVRQLCLGVYKGTTVSSYLRSQAGDYPTVIVSQASLINMMPYYKTGANAYRRAEYEDYRIRGAYNLLAASYLGSRSTQSVYRGVCDYSWSTGSVSDNVGESGKSGVTDSLGTGVVSGEITSYNGTDLASGKRPFKLLGVENPWGLVWENIYGAVHNSGLVYTYQGSDELTASQLTPGDGNTVYVNSGIQMPTGTQWQTTVAEKNGFLFPTGIGGNDNTYNGDFYWYGNGWRILSSGGHLFDGSYDGAFALAGDDAWGTLTAYLGARLSFII